jgi:hypothetical protein
MTTIIDGTTMTQQTVVQAASTGAFVSTNYPITFSRRGETKFAYFPAITNAAAASTATVNFAAGTVPGPYLPLSVNNSSLPATAAAPVRLFVNSTNQMGLLLVAQDGSMTLCADLNGGSFTSGQSIGYGSGGFTATYT